MTATENAPAQRGLAAQLLRFVAVGGVSAVVDFAVYHLILALEAPTWLARAISFVCGTTTAYFLNKRFTFGEAAGGRGRLAGFVLLYGTTFGIAVGVNALALYLLPDIAFKASIAWVISQGTATAINFVMLRWVVFRAR
ncbi:GtrA family protein [Pseudonocardia oroxyli]|uniref:Putative flippase GtrA (Transmembrane translocase of bactoprenol-linked glucose) n=1 Tax=Pseudonocardia oroxyli TaxID=366584 RepID=A0A1G7M8S5_PSEOR|nr:GtrA family protein [Pseudonocardia oroxyli]SDF57639.1 Putative flippase GtrA (transmembrane translocase of bactoprenol-linked glucose) [Pseudonocardia oroxyli]